MKKLLTQTGVNKLEDFLGAFFANFFPLQNEEGIPYSKTVSLIFSENDVRVAFIQPKEMYTRRTRNFSANTLEEAINKAKLDLKRFSQNSVNESDQNEDEFSEGNFKEELRHAYIDLGLSIKKAAKKIGASEYQVRRGIHEFGIGMRKKGHHIPKTKKKSMVRYRTSRENAHVLDKDLLMRLYVEKGLGLKTISQKYKVPVSVIHGKLSEYNIPVKLFHEKRSHYMERFGRSGL